MSFLIGASVHGSLTADRARIVVVGDRSLLVGATTIETDHVASGATQVIAMAGFLSATRIASLVLVGGKVTTDGTIRDLVHQLAAGGNHDAFRCQIYSMVNGDLEQVTLTANELHTELPNCSKISLVNVACGPQLSTIVATEAIEPTTMGILSSSMNRAVWVTCSEELSSNDIVEKLNDVKDLRESLKDVEPEAATFAVGTDGGKALVEDLRVHALSTARSEVEANNIEKAFSFVASAMLTETSLFKEEHNVMTSHVESLESLVEQLTTSLATSETRISSQQGRIEELEGALEEASRLLDGHESTIKELSDDLANQRNANDDHSVKSKTAEEERDRIAKTLSEVEKVLDEVQQEAEEKDGIIADMRAKAQQSNDSMGTLEDDKKRLVGRIQELETTIAEHIKDIEHASYEREDIANKAAREREGLRREMMTLVMEFQAKEKQWQRIVVDAKELREEMQHENAKIRTMAERQSRSVTLLKEASALYEQQQNSMITDLYDKVQTMSPRRGRADRPAGHLMSPSPPTTNSSDAAASGLPAVAADQLVGHERVVDI